jgi:hypothetical protein
MPLTREQTKYQSTNDTVFLPTVAIDRNLGVKGSAIVEQNLTIGGTLSASSFNYSGPLSGTTLTLSGGINSTNTASTSRNIHTFQNFPGSVFSIRSHGSSYSETLLGNSVTGSTTLLSTTGDLLIGTFTANNLIFGSNNAERMRIDSSGNVGIGAAASGSYIFDIQRVGTGTSTGARIFNSATSAGSGSRFDFQQGAVNTFIDSVSNATGRVGTSTNHPFDIMTNNTTRMTFAAAGGITTNGTFNVTSSSNVLLNTDSGGSISMGRVDGTATNPYIDFNSGATAVDYDVRVQATGGTGTVGQGTLTISGNLVQNVNTTAKTGAYTLARLDANTLVQMNGAFAFTVPLNSTTPFPTGTIINLLALTAGVSVVFTGGITSYATPGLKLRAAGSMATLIKLNTDTWVLSGDLTA